MEDRKQERMQEYEAKRLFVEKFVKPMVIAMNIEATDVVYDADVNEKGYAFETVTVYYGEDRLPKAAVVNLDSKRAILKDMFSQGAI